MAAEAAGTWWRRPGWRKSTLVRVFGAAGVGCSAAAGAGVGQPELGRGFAGSVDRVSTVTDVEDIAAGRVEWAVAAST
jgi:hypothetical protein